MNPCPVCGGELALLGQLGLLVHFRCTACGHDSSCEANDLPNVEDDPPPEFDEPVEGES